MGGAAPCPIARKHQHPEAVPGRPVRMRPLVVVGLTIAIQAAGCQGQVAPGSSKPVFPKCRSLEVACCADPANLISNIEVIRRVRDGGRDG
jgi:hypothetical protein